MTLLNYITAHWLVIGAALSYIGLAIVNALPKPGTPFSWYEVFYYTMTALANRQHGPVQPVPDPKA